MAVHRSLRKLVHRLSITNITLEVGIGDQTLALASSKTATPAVGNQASKQESKKASGGGGPGQSWTKTVEICCYKSSSACINKTFNLPLKTWLLLQELVI